MIQARKTLSPSEEAEEKKWSKRRFYQAMRFRFRRHRDREDPENRPDSEDPKNLVTIPFHVHRPLSCEEFEACLQRYVYARRRQHLRRMDAAQAGLAEQDPHPDRLPNLQGRGLDPALQEQCNLALVRLYVTNTQIQKEHARQRVKDLAEHPQTPAWLKQALRKARVATPQEQRKYFGITILRLVNSLAKHEFRREFLRQEAEWTGNQLDTSEALMDAARTLKTAYPYLHLTADEIAQGLNCPTQADQDTADEIGLKKSSIRPLLSLSTKR